MPTEVVVKMVPKSWHLVRIPLIPELRWSSLWEDEPIDVTRFREMTCIDVPLVLWTGETSSVEGYVGWTLIAGQKGADHVLRGFVREDDAVLSGLLKSDLIARLDLLAAHLDHYKSFDHRERAVTAVREIEAAERRAGQERMDRLGLNMLQHVP